MLFSGAAFGGAIIGGGSGFVSPAPFSPASLSDLRLWLDAAAITGANDGDALATWSGRSGQHNDATQASAARRPTYQLVGGTGGNPVLRFDGVDDGFLLTGLLAPPQLYVAMMVRTSAADNDKTLLCTYQNGRGGYLVGFRNAGTSLKWYPPDITSAAGAGGMAPDTFTLIECIHDGTALNLFVNGTNVLYSAFPLTYTSDPSFCTSLGYLALTSTNPYGEYWSGDIAELIGAGAIPDAGTRTALRDYMNSKWES